MELTSGTQKRIEKASCAKEAQILKNDLFFLGCNKHRFFQDSGRFGMDSVLQHGAMSDPIWGAVVDFCYRCCVCWPLWLVLRWYVLFLVRLHIDFTLAVFSSMSAGLGGLVGVRSCAAYATRKVEVLRMDAV